MIENLIVPSLNTFIRLLLFLGMKRSVETSVFHNERDETSCRILGGVFICSALLVSFRDFWKIQGMTYTRACP